MSVSHWQADGTQPIEEVDFLVIGAGIAGCMAAYLANQAGHDVIITEATHLAGGATGRNAGFMITGLDTYYHRAVEKYGEAVTREMWTISEETHAYWHKFVKIGDVPFKQVGSLLLAESEAEAKDLELAIHALDQAGIEAEYLSYDPLGRGFQAAIRQKQDAAIQPVKLAQTILKESDARLIDNNAVYAIRQTKPDVVEVDTRLYRFRARHVLLCTNAYSPLIDDFFTGKVIPTRAQCLITEKLPQGTLLNSLGYSDYGYMYYRDTFDGRLLLGGARNRHKASENDTTEDRLNPIIQAALDDYLADKFKDVDVPVARRWTGIMGFTPDGLPIVGKLPDKSRVGFAVGFNGHGLAMSAAIVERAVDMLLTNASVGALDVQRLK